MIVRKLRILCVDDHAFLVEGLKARFGLEQDLEVIARLSSAENLVPEAMRLKPDIVLLDIEMPGPDPFDAADDLRRRCPDIKVIMLSAYVRDHYLSAALKAGVWGYFSKSDDPDAIVDGLRKAAKGEFVMGPKVAARCKPVKPGKRSRSAPKEAPKSKLETLTTREQEVLRFIGRGLSRTQIAETISRSPKTVDGHRERIMAKLDIHSGPELVRFAIREGVAEG